MMANDALNQRAQHLRSRAPAPHRAAMVATVLEGAKPGDIPIERPTKFEFLLNMKTIEALGLTVPGALLLSAERVNR